jgi:hypothetical protein
MPSPPRAARMSAAAPSNSIGPARSPPKDEVEMPRALDERISPLSHHADQIDFPAQAAVLDDGKLGPQSRRRIRKERRKYPVLELFHVDLKRVYTIDAFA